MGKRHITIIGGGSRQWAIQFMKDLALNTSTEGYLTLYDIDNQAAENNVHVAERIFRLNHAEGRFVVNAEKDIDKALDGKDFVIISIEPGNTSCRWGDLVLPEQYGILETVGDTTGPGGIMRARRALPLFFEFARKIKEHCPNAWVINYTNPMTLCTAALYRAFPQIKALGCCHEVFGTEYFVAKQVATWFGVPQPDRRDIHLDITGVNHFTFATKAQWNGVDLMPMLRKLAEDPATYVDRTTSAKERIAKEEWFTCDHVVALTFLRDFGALGAAGDRHLSEFVPYFLTSDADIWKLGIMRTPYDWRVRVAKEKHDKVFTDDELLAKKSDEEGVDIMRSLFGERTLFTNINIPNHGQVSYLKEGHIVESNGYISQNSIKPVISSDPPLAVETLVKRVADVQDLTLDAIWENDEKKLFQAFVCDPLVHLPLSTARELFDKMLKASALKY